MARKPTADETWLLPEPRRRMDGPERVYLCDLGDYLFISTVAAVTIARRLELPIYDAQTMCAWVTPQSAARVILAQRAADGSEIMRIGYRGRRLCPFQTRHKALTRQQRKRARWKARGKPL